MKMTIKALYTQPVSKRPVDYEDYGVDTLINYERERELSVYEMIKKERQMTVENQVAYDNKVANAQTLYKDLPPWAQEFVDEYRSSMVRIGRINGTGPDEILKFIHKVKELVDRTVDNIFMTATKGEIGNYTKGSGV